MTDGWEVLEWAALGLCGQVDNDLFFPEFGMSDTAAKQVCRRCPVRRRCLTYALTNDVTGIWGGTNDADRRKLGGAA